MPIDKELGGKYNLLIGSIIAYAAHDLAKTEKAAAFGFGYVGALEIWQKDPISAGILGILGIVFAVRSARHRRIEKVGKKWGAQVTQSESPSL